MVTQNAKHKRATFLSVPSRALRGRLEKPVEQFQAYFMALFSDKDYSKVLDSIAKVDKSLRALSTSYSASSATRSNFKNTRLMCNFCGIPGHSSPFCFKKRRGSARGRSPPYQRAPRTKDNSNPQ